MSRRVYQVRPLFLPVFLVVILIALLSRSALAQPSLPSDTLRRGDTLLRDTAVADSTGRESSAAVPAPVDTARLFSYAGTLGSTAGEIEDAGYRFVTMRELVDERYYTLFDILSPLLPAYPLSQGSPGLVRLFSYAGASPGAIGVLYNGRQLPGDLEGGYDPELYPPEFFNRVEILRGARATLYGGGESLIALNLVQPRYDVEGSYVRLGYAQGLYNTTSADITYARNIGSRSNLTLGLHRVANDGEFDNQSVSNTSLRGVYTINPVEGLALSLSEIYYNAERHLNGGLTPASLRDRNNEDVVEPSLYEEQIRHDLTLAARWAPLRRRVATTGDTLAGESPSTAIDGALYYTFARRDLLGRVDSIRTGEWRREIVGARASASLPAGALRADINLVAELAADGFADSVDGETAGRAEAGLLGELALGALTLRAGGKIAAGADDAIRTTIVGEGIVGISEAFSARATLRMFDGGGGGIATGSRRRFADVPTALLGEGVIEWRQERLRIGIDAFYRQGRESAGNTYGAGGTLGIPLPWQLTLDADLLGQIDPDGADRFPAIRASGDLWGAWKIFRDNLDLRAGTTVVYQSALRGAEYDPLSGDMLYPDATARDLSTQYPVWGVYAQGRIGSAFLRAALDNILDVEQWTIHRYPVTGRGLHLQVTWVLID